jgi:hypothetical protein
MMELQKRVFILELREVTNNWYIRPWFVQSLVVPSLRGSISFNPLTHPVRNEISPYTFSPQYIRSQYIRSQYIQPPVYSILNTVTPRNIQL